MSQKTRRAEPSRPPEQQTERVPVAVYMMNPTNLKGSAGARSVRVDARMTGVQNGCLYVLEIRISHAGIELHTAKGIENLVPWANVSSVHYADA